MFDFAQRRTRRTISLTPMIDVVFLLLVFFMLVARFGLDQAIPLALGGNGGTTWEGPPRLVEVRPDTLALNGVELSERALLIELVRLTETGEDPVLLRPGSGSDVQRLVDVMELMGAAGFGNLVIVEAGR